MVNWDTKDAVSGPKYAMESSRNSPGHMIILESRISIIELAAKRELVMTTRFFRTDRSLASSLVVVPASRKMESPSLIKSRHFCAIRTFSSNIIPDLIVMLCSYKVLLLSKAPPDSMRTRP